MKRLVVCCDGTWNTPDQQQNGGHAPTNVVKVALALAPADGNGREQRLFYHRGVGTDPAERIRGGVFGFGLGRNVREAYRFLVQHFEPGDELFFFGFSRGAYTARSVAGFVRNCGILRPEHANRLGDAYELYRERTNQARPRGVEAQLFRRSFSHETPVRFIGVWDTVGAHGIPVGGGRLAEWLNRRWQFHNNELSSEVQAAFQALAVDEYRRAFRPAIWRQSDSARDQRLEQVWFAGAHSDVGGGLQQTGLSDIALLWMVDRARECGLEFLPDTFRAIGPAGTVVAPDALGPIDRSRRGLYRLLRPFTREITAGESVSGTAIERHRLDPTYAPANLVSYLERTGGQPAPSATNDAAVARVTGSSGTERRAS